MKMLLIALLLLAGSRAQAQYLTLRQLLVLAEKTPNNFQGDDDSPGEAGNILRASGFARVRWRENDPDIDGNPGSYKRYSRRTDAFLVFQADSHDRLLENLIYRVHSTACVVQLRQQLRAAGFKGLNSHPAPPSDPNELTAPVSPYNTYCTNLQYTVSIDGEVDREGRDLHCYTVTISRDAAMQQMYDEINAVREEAAPVRNAKPRKKPR
ncbi:hypothetical protein GCM10027594_34210 [Hymenobacter agri]